MIDDWIKIKDMIPGRPRLVLVCGLSKPLNIWYYHIGMLGGSRNEYVFRAEGERGHDVHVTATKWQELRS